LKNTKLIGVGAFGKVYRTKNRIDPSMEVAIKVLDKIKLQKKYKALDVIMAEIKILNTLDHPNIVKYFETYDDSRYIYLVMEYVKGSDLFECIKNKKRFSEKKLAEYMRSLFSAIQHCHSNGVIHRDIKIENIMITSDDSVRLIDFGLSKIKTDDENFYEVAGTIDYMAPEVLAGNCDMSADIWSLGVVLYILASGYYPFSGKVTSQSP
jgi:calcium-dependent protein kinase